MPTLDNSTFTYNGSSVTKSISKLDGVRSNYSLSGWLKANFKAVNLSENFKNLDVTYNLDFVNYSYGEFIVTVSPKQGYLWLTNEKTNKKQLIVKFNGIDKTGYITLPQNWVLDSVDYWYHDYLNNE